MPMHFFLGGGGGEGVKEVYYGICAKYPVKMGDIGHMLASWLDRSKSVRSNAHIDYSSFFIYCKAKFG